ncbi:hypothetical protein IQ22_02433 [Pseudomonas duriflava]|uniref:Uncharacterized protein n=1 Tax=Pseudomonas duriflava TaxID=459528 RepID=A0A562QAS0_9PSED|nr:hypothetical protein IQ22_02433 [Pseudomonas duriflava]
MFKAITIRAWEAIGKGYGYSLWIGPPLALLLIILQETLGWKTKTLVIAVLAIYAGPMLILGSFCTLALMGFLLWRCLKLSQSAFRRAWFRRSFLTALVLVLLPVSQIVLTELNLGGPFPIHWMLGSNPWDFLAMTSGLAMGNPWAWALAIGVMLSVRLCWLSPSCLDSATKA